MKMTVISIIYGALGTVPENLAKRLGELEIRGRTESVQTTAQLRLARILRKVLKIRGDLLSLKLR